MQPLPNDGAVADDHDDIVSSPDNTWSRQNHGAQATKPRKRGISNPTAPPPKVRQRKTNMEKCAHYEYETASMTVAAQQVVDSSTLKDTGPSAREKELEARAALLQKTAMAKMEGFLKLNSDWMSLSSDLGGLSISDSKAQCSNDPKDLMTQVRLFSAAIADRSSTIQHYKQKEDELEIEKERSRGLDIDIGEYKKELAVTRRTEQRLRNERNFLRSQVNTCSSVSNQTRTASTQTSDAWDRKMVTLEQNLTALTVDLEKSKRLNADAEKTAKDHTARDGKSISELRKELAAAGSLSKRAKDLQEKFDRASSKFRQQATEIKRLEEFSIKQQEDNDILHEESLCQKTQIESLEKNEKRSAAQIDKLEKDLQQSKLDLISARSEIGVLKGSLTSETTGLTEAMHRFRELERSYRQQEHELDSLRDLESEREKAKRLQDDLRHNSSKLQFTQAELERTRKSANASAGKLRELRGEMRELKSAMDEVQMDNDNTLSEKMDLEEDRDSLRSAVATLEKERDSILSERTILQGERARLLFERNTLQEEKESLEKEKLDQLMESQRGQTDLLAKVDQAKKQKEDVLSQRDELKAHIAEKASELEEQQRMALSLQISLESSTSEFADSRQCIMALIPLIFDQISRRRIIATQLRQLANRMESTTLENQHHLANISALKDQVQSERAALRKLPKCNRFFYQKMWWLMFEFGDQGGFECVCLKDDVPKEVRKRLMAALEEKLPPEDVLVALEEKHVGSVIL